MRKLTFPIQVPDYTCPICSGGFVEELPPAISSNSSVGGSSSTNNTGLMGSSNDEQQLEALRGQIANLLASRNGSNLEININPSSMRSQPRGIVSLGSVTTGGGRVRPQSLDGLDNVLLDVLQSISVGSGAVAGEMNPFDNSHLLFMGLYSSMAKFAWHLSHMPQVLNGEEEDDNDVLMDNTEDHNGTPGPSLCPIHQQQQQNHNAVTNSEQLGLAILP
ncbi:hypothetical protein EVAR_101647_1 [Eumeta japonica]|uniref:Uncharacterized protein n=1 Tax=Eumeta variegata TaxID=151549 RepID=A0A4C1TE93_EUMVA|nr:hypothetical protein EVAR_101647_1 [Eumeta japonica]